MPLTACHAELGLVDSTRIEGRALELVRMHQAPLTCADPTCGWAMYSKVSPRGLLFFAHKGDRPSDLRCSSSGESAEHRNAKVLIRDAVSALPDWNAEFEVAGDGWRADVLATGPDGRRIAWEVQKSSIDQETASERTARLQSAGVEVVWLDLTKRGRDSLRRLPHTKANLFDESTLYVFAAKPRTYGRDFLPQWQPERLSIVRFAALICAEQITWDGERWTADAYRAQYAELQGEHLRLLAERAERGRIEREERQRQHVERAERERAEYEERQRQHAEWRAGQAEREQAEYVRRQEARLDAQRAQEEQRRNVEQERVEAARQAQERRAETLRESETIDVPAPLRWRHVRPSDAVIGADQRAWHVDSADPGRGRIHVTAWRDGRQHSAAVDPDDVVEVLVPSDELDALKLLRSELGAQVIDRTIGPDPR